MRNKLMWEHAREAFLSEFTRFKWATPDFTTNSPSGEETLFVLELTLSQAHFVVQPVKNCSVQKKSFCDVWIYLSFKIQICW